MNNSKTSQLKETSRRIMKMKWNKRRIASPPHCTRLSWFCRTELKLRLSRASSRNKKLIKRNIKESFWFRCFFSSSFHFTSCHRFNVMCVFRFGHRDLIRNDYFSIVQEANEESFIRCLSFHFDFHNVAELRARLLLGSLSLPLTSHTTHKTRLARRKKFLKLVQMNWLYHWWR